MNMALMTIQEYINSQGKTIEKALSTKSPSTDKPPARPEKNQTKGKNYSFPAASDKQPNPYLATTIKMPKKDDDAMGLGDLGTPDTDYSATSKDVDSVSELKEHCGCEKKKAPFVVAYSSGAYHPDPIQAIKYIVYLTNENENILKALMHEARKTGCLKKYTDYLTKAPELYQSLQDRIANDGPEMVLHRIGIMKNEAKILDINSDKVSKSYDNKPAPKDKPKLSDNRYPKEAKKTQDKPLTKSYPKPNPQDKKSSKDKPADKRSQGDKVYEKGLSDYAT